SGNGPCSQLCPLGQVRLRDMGRLRESKQWAIASNALGSFLLLSKVPASAGKVNPAGCDRDADALRLSPLSPLGRGVRRCPTPSPPTPLPRERGGKHRALPSRFVTS